MSIAIPIQYQTPVTDFSTPSYDGTAIRATFRDDRDGNKFTLPVTSIQRADDKNYTITVVTADIPKYVTKGSLTLSLDQGYTKTALNGLPALAQNMTFVLNRPGALVPRLVIFEETHNRTQTEAVFQVGITFPAVVPFTDPNSMEIALTDARNRAFPNATLRDQGIVKTFTVEPIDVGDANTSNYVLRFVVAYDRLAVNGINTGTITATIPGSAVTDASGRGNFSQSASTLFQFLATPLTFQLSLYEGSLAGGLQQPSMNGAFYAVDGEFYLQVRWNHPVKLAEHGDADITANFGMDKLDVLFYPLDGQEYVGELEAGLLPKNPASGPGVYDFAKVDDVTFRVRVNVTEWQITRSDLTTVLVNEGLLIARVKAGDVAYMTSFLTDPATNAPVVKSTTTSMSYNIRVVA